MSRAELTASKFIPHAETTIDSFIQELSSGESFNDLRASQQARARASLADMRRMDEMLNVLIERYIDDPQRLSDLFALKEVLSATLETYGPLVPDEAPTAPVASTSTALDDDYEAYRTAESSLALSLAEDEDEGDPDEEIECSICYTEYTRKELVRLSCKHLFCNECVQMYLKSKIDEADVVDIKCPDKDCSQSFTSEEIELLVSPELFEKYKRFSILAAIRADPTARYCVKPGCEGVSQGAPEKGRWVSCPLCDTNICYDCAQAGHDGACKPRKLTKEERRTEKWMKRKGVQHCPECGVGTVRFGGCPSITCPECGHEWEWKMQGGEETALEKWAFLYPRMVYGLAGAKELVEDAESTGERVLAAGVMGGITAVVFAPLIPVTLIAGPPALVIKGGRKIWHGIEDVIDHFKE